MVITAQDINQKPGYKQTEVGVIPEDWELKPIGESFDICNHLRYPISQDVRKKMVGEYPYYGPTRAQDYINEYRVEGEYALIGEDGDHFLKWRESPMTLLVNGKFNVNNHAHLVKGARNLTSWFYYYFQNKDLTPYLTRQGAGRYKLTKNILITIPCPLPSPSEQQAIVTALSEVDALITSLDRLIAKKREIKQATMQQLLTGKIRLPGFSGEWKVRKLGEVAEIGMGRTPSRRNQTYWGRGYKWLSIADLKSKYIFETKEEITTLAASDMTVIPKGTLVMSFKLTIGKLAFTGCDMYSNEAICSLTKLRADAEYLYYILSQTDFSLYGKQAVKGYTLNTDSLNSVEILYPEIPEQQALVAILSDMDAEIATLEQKRDKTRALKQGMMQELLTGKTRLI